MYFNSGLQFRPLFCCGQFKYVEMYTTNVIHKTHMNMKNLMCH